MKVIHPQDAQFFMDGPEVCRQYIATEKNYLWDVYFAAWADRRNRPGTR